MHFVTKQTLAVIVIGLSILTSCKKDTKNDPTPPSTDTTATVSEADKVKDTTLADIRDVYLWYNQIPASFNPRLYANPDSVMSVVRRNYSHEPGFTDPVDRWSFAMTQTDWNNLSSGTAADFGLGIFFLGATDLRVKSVEQASPAGLAGIHRGWRITKINGNSTINTSQSSINFIVDAVFNSTNASFTFEKPDGTTTDITLAATTYQENPIYLDSVYNIGGKKIGYLVFNSFLGDTTQIYNAFNSVFSNFVSQGVSDLVVDLRYNGGGYVTMQQRLANYIAPASANGNLMMKTSYNDKYSRYNYSENFTKLGSLNLSRVFFIVSQNTASASELLINNLKPFMDVQLVGPQKTHGKPVGFFPLPAGDWYVFPVSFRTVNKNGEGGYFNGLALNKTAADGLDKDWGDLQESCLANAINYITTGAYLGQPSGRSQVP